MPHPVRRCYRQNPLACKRAGAVLLVSTLIMLISIGVFMVREYHKGMERLEQVELTALPGTGQRPAASIHMWTPKHSYTLPRTHKH